MWKVRWGNDLFTAETADGVLAQIADRQWSTTTNIQKTIADRLWRLDRLIVDDTLSGDQFLKALAELRIVVIVTHG